MSYLRIASIALVITVPAVAAAQPAGAPPPPPGAASPYYQPAPAPAVRAAPPPSYVAEASPPRLGLGFGAAPAPLSSNGGNLAVSSDNAAAVMLGASLDLIRARHWALDVHARYGQGFYGDSNDDGKADVTARNAGIGVGFTYLL